MADQSTRPAARGDEAELFRDFHPKLMEQISKSVYDVRPDVIEDACSFAWFQFMSHQPDRARNWQGWMFRTAQREVWRIEREGREHARHQIPLRTSAHESMKDFAEPAVRRNDNEIRLDVNDAFAV